MVPADRADALQFFSGARPSRAVRFGRGELIRRRVPLHEHASVPAGGRNPLTLLQAQDGDRDPIVVPLRYQRMSIDPFAYLRGSAAVMAHDLSTVPASGITVQLCGDAHLANFGVFSTQERNRIFDLNDFDETLPGPFEWDVKRLVASVCVAGLVNEVKPRHIRRAARLTAAAYRKAMIRASQQGALQPWSIRVDLTGMVDELRRTPLGRQIVGLRRESRRKTQLGAADKWTEVVDGRRRFCSDPPLLTPVAHDELPQVISQMSTSYADYVNDLAPEVVALLARFSVTDVARKIVGVGSVGTQALVMLMESGDGEPVILQMKQAGSSVLEAYLRPSRYGNGAKRVVIGQRLLQAAGDPFLGWCATERGPDLYIRQLWDSKASVDYVSLDGHALAVYGRLCGDVLAHGHARVGDSAMVAGYLGESDEFDRAVIEFGMGYADLVVQDFGQLAGSAPELDLTASASHLVVGGAVQATR